MNENRIVNRLTVENLKPALVAFLTFFRQVAQYIDKFNKEFFGGNLDPYYLLGIAFFYDTIKNKRKKDLTIFIIFIACIFLYAIIQLIFVPEITIVRLIINILKIYICFACMLFIKNNYDKIDLKKVIYFFSILNTLFVIIACTIGRDSDVFWRFNDTVNVYSETRLKLFFLEPSELGYHIAIVLIFAIYFLLKSDNNRERLYLIGCIISNGFTMILAKPMGAICILAISLGVMLVIDFFSIKSKTRKKIYLIVFGIGLIILLIMIFSKNEIILRVFDTINGEDQSNTYRINVTYNVFAKSLEDYHLLGCGFGNLNTDHFMNNYDELVTVIVNSAIYFCIETGIFGICSLISLFTILIKRTIESKNILKWGLLLFIVIYQFFGSHFTNGLTWAIYGIIISEFEVRRKIKDAR